MKELSINDKVNIVYDSLVNKMNHSDIARKHRITMRMVGTLTKIIKSDKEYFKTLRNEKNKKERKHQLIEERAKSIINSNIPLESAF